MPEVVVRWARLVSGDGLVRITPYPFHELRDKITTHLHLASSVSCSQIGPLAEPEPTAEARTREYKLVGRKGKTLVYHEVLD